MADVTLDRPIPSTVLRELTGTIPRAPEAIFATLVAAVGPRLMDAAQLLAIVQGDYWYRAEYRVSADAAGSRVDLVLLNVAARPHWLGALTGRAAIRDAGDAFEGLLRSLG